MFLCHVVNNKLKVDVVDKTCGIGFSILLSQVIE
jgi:hypothetical protein